MRLLPGFRLDLLTFLVGGALAAGVGCTQNVTPVGGGTTGDETDATSSAGGSGSTSHGTAGAGIGGAGAGGSGTGGVGTTAVAMLDSELPEIGGGGEGTSVGVGGSTNDPNALHVFIADTATLTCGDPWSGPPCELHWAVSFKLDPTQQHPGIFTMEEVFGYSSESGTFYGPGECSGGGGSFWDGQVEITSIDAAGVGFTLSGTEIIGSDAVTDGSYTAPRCPAP